MTDRRIFVYGASGHGKVIGDILLTRKHTNFVGFIDDSVELLGTDVIGLPVFGDGNWLQQESRKMRLTVALGVADNFVRQRLAQKCLNWGIELATLVHPAASVSASARLGAGTVVMANAVVNPDAKIGSCVVVNTGAVVEHDVCIGDFAFVAPNAAMGGAASLGMLSHLGIGAVVIQRIAIGAHAIVGAGSVVVRNIPDSVVAFGVPARVHRNL